MKQISRGFFDDRRRVNRNRNAKHIVYRIEYNITILLLQNDDSYTARDNIMCSAI